LGTPDCPVIDTDTHLTERHDLFTSRAPAKWKERVPQVKKINGVAQWVIEGDKILGSTRASSVILPDLSKGQGWSAVQYLYEDVHPASYDVKERLRVMDETGIAAAIVYPNLLGFGGNKIPAGDPQLRVLCCQIYNDAMAEVQETSGQRMFPMALLPWWDREESIAEARRTRAMGLRGVNISADPQNQGLPDLASRHWDPLWEAVSDLGMPVNFHIGASEDQQSWFGSSPWPSQHDDVKLAIGGTTLQLANARVIANLILAGIPERFPRLRFVSVESGVGWIPYMLESLDYYASDITPEVVSQLSLKPSEYFRRQFYACFWFERKMIGAMIDVIGQDNVMFETDFPHSTCLYPNAVDYVSESLANIDPEVRRKVLSGNAAKLYSIDLAA
jgi:predicted TIM-barrel fold metal-dependent hydrolase